MKKFSILTTIMLIAALAFQTQAAPRDTQETSYALIQARAGETIEVGHLVVVRAPGYLAWKATDANTNAVIALGRAETGAVSNGLFYAKPGIFKWASTGTITETSVGAKRHGHELHDRHDRQRVHQRHRRGENPARRYRRHLGQERTLAALRHSPITKTNRGLKTMLITPSAMSDLFKTFSTKFNDAQKAASGRVGKYGLLIDEVATTMTVTGASTTHAWMEQIRAMREWVGARVINNIKLGGLTVVNRSFENTIGVPVTAIEDDQYGTFAPLMGMMGADGETLLEPPLRRSACRKRRLGGRQSVLLLRPPPERTQLDDHQRRDDRAQLRRDRVRSAQSKGWKLFGGEPAEVTPTVLLVGPAKESAARTILEAELVNDGNDVQVTNTLKGRLLLRVDPRITGNQWYVLAEKNGMKAVVIQKRKVAVLTRRDSATDSCVFDKGAAYGTDARGEAAQVPRLRRWTQLRHGMGRRQRSWLNNPRRMSFKPLMRRDSGI